MFSSAWMRMIALMSVSFILLGLVAASATASVTPGVNFTGWGLSETTVARHFLVGHKTDPEIVARTFERTSSAVVIKVRVGHINPNAVSGSWEQIQVSSVEIVTQAKTASGRRLADISLPISIDTPGASQVGNATGCETPTYGVNFPGGGRINRTNNTYVFTFPTSVFTRCGVKHGQRLLVYGSSEIYVDDQPYSQYGQAAPLKGGQWTANDSHNWYAFTY